MEGVQYALLIFCVIMVLFPLLAFLSPFVILLLAKIRAIFFFDEDKTEWKFVSRREDKYYPKNSNLPPYKVYWDKYVRTHMKTGEEEYMEKLGEKDLDNSK